MLAREFWDWVQNDPCLLYDGGEEGATPDEDVIRVITRNPDTGELIAKFEIQCAGIKDAQRRDFEGVFRGERPPEVMKHIARIVGYYSFVSQWNRSKRAELADRRKAAKYYAVPEVA